MKSFALLTTLVCASQVVHSYDYASRDYWDVSDSTNCKGRRQSPIAINSSDVQDLYFYNQLTLRNYDIKIPGKLKNNGHTLQFDPTQGPGTVGVTQPCLSCAVLQGEYEFLQYHFHWGATNDRGSEHTIDGIQFPMEMHMVHINKRYNGNVANALAASDGLAVLGIMFQISYQTSPALTTLLTGLDAIIAAGGDKDDDYDITDAMNTDLLDYLALVGRSYYHYKGSLTTPTCNEVVDWIVLENAIDITEADMAKFRMLLTEDNAPMVDNFRNPQPINNRFVKRVFN